MYYNANCIKTFIGIWYAFTGQPATQKLLLYAAAMSFVWVSWYNYDYNASDQVKVWRLNITTWILWTVALLSVGIWWSFLGSMCGSSLTLVQRLAITGVLWTAIIMIVEWIGYNVLNIRLKSNYPGLFGLKLMHGPVYLKVYYLTAWLIFLLLVHQFDLT